MVPDAKTTCLGLEYFCSKTDKLWNLSDKDLIKQASGELEYLGLAESRNVVGGKVVRVENAYPIYDKGYQSKINIVRNYLRRLDNLQVIGRGGMHKYNNQDHAMMTGILAAKNVIEKRFDLWKVSVDAKYTEKTESEGNFGLRSVPKRV